MDLTTMAPIDKKALLERVTKGRVKKKKVEIFQLCWNPPPPPLKLENIQFFFT